MTKLFLLQSGFVTPNATFLVKEDEHDLSVRDKLYLADTRISDNTSYYDESIEKLFNVWHKNNGHIRKFEFRQEILAAAFRVFKFNSPSIAPWLRLQLTQRTVGYLHRKYLKETMAFVFFQNLREMDNYTYYRLLNPDGDNDVFQTGLEDPDMAIREFVKDESVNLTDVMNSWTRNTASFIDLLITMHVIFGRRPGNKTTRMMT